MALQVYYPDSNTLIYAAKQPDGRLAHWLKRHKLILTDLNRYETLDQWVGIDLPQHAAEKFYLLDGFRRSMLDERYLVSRWNESPNAYEERASFLQGMGLRLRDAYHAPVAEQNRLILLTADEKLLLQLDYLNREYASGFMAQDVRLIQDAEWLARLRESGEAEKAKRIEERQERFDSLSR